MKSSKILSGLLVAVVHLAALSGTSHVSNPERLYSASWAQIAKLFPFNLSQCESTEAFHTENISQSDHKLRSCIFEGEKIPESFSF